MIVEASLTAGVHFIGVSETDALMSMVKTEAATLFKLSTSGVGTRAEFFDAVRNDLPLDPPLMGSQIFDALQDSVWGGLLNIYTSTLVIVWEGSTKFQNENRSDYDIAIDVFQSISHGLGNPKYSGDKSPKKLCVYVIQ